jgi:nucleosome binding factor SPN SPT16 subunit
MALIDAHIFWRRLLRLHNSFTSDANWYGVDAISIPLEKTSEETSFNKSSAIFIHLFGRELPGSLIVLCEGAMHIVASAKKCAMLESLQKASPNKEVALVIHRASKEGDNAEVYKVLVNVIKQSRGGTKLGYLSKMQFHGILANTWDAAIRSAELQRVDITIALGLSMSTKDEDASSSLRRAAAITHKVLKHGIVRLVEDAFDQAKPITHEELASKAEEFCEDPSKIKLNVPPGQLESCYFPIIQSGGEYDLRPSAATNNEPLSDDVVIVSLGARYKFYCANIARTFFVDPVPKIETTYGILLELRRECLALMLAGHRIGDVSETASNFISHKYPYMLECLPKSLGFGLGLDFREAALLLNSKNPHRFEPNMVFSLAVGFHHVPLDISDKIDAAGSVRKLSKYSMLVADTVIIRAGGEPPELLTKHSVEWRDVSYFINENSEHHINLNYEGDGGASTAMASRNAVLSSRLRERTKSIDDGTRGGNREEKQIELMRHKLASRRVTDSYRQKRQNTMPSHLNVSEIEAYSSTRDYPSDLPPNEIYVDMEGQVVFVPINGSPVPFHISMIKNTVQPDPDRASA